MKRLKKLFDKQVKIECATDKEIPNAYGYTQGIFFNSAPSLGKERTTFAYLGVPNAKKPNAGFPAVVLVHGGGGCAFFEWVEYWNKHGYVALAFDCGGRQFGSREHDGKGTAEVNPHGRYMQPDDNGSFYKDKESVCDSWTYHNVANIILAHNILRDNIHVNKDKIVLTGISWGGVLTALTSGIDDRFLAFAPVYGTGYLLQCHVVPENLTIANIDEWEKCYDPKYYVSHNKKPILFTLGTDDAAFSTKDGQLTYEKTQGKITYSYRYRLEHYHRWKDEEQMVHVVKFMDLHCKGISLPFEIISEKKGVKQFSVQVNNPDKVKKVYFNYTDSTEEDCRCWKWQQIEVALQGDRVMIEHPQEITYCFFELSDCEQKEFVVSSSLKIEKQGEKLR